MVLTKGGLVCRIHLIGNDYNVDNNDGTEIHQNMKEVAELSLSVANAPIFRELMHPAPQLLSSAAAFYMGAVCKSDSGSISYGSSISLKGFLDCTDSKNDYYKGN